jgi:hypothetical protein
MKPKYIAYMNMTNSNEFLVLSQRPTLRHSFYRALNHHFTSLVQADLALRQTELDEIEMHYRHKLEEIDLLLRKQVPLQARLDLILDDDSNFLFPSEVDLDLMQQDDPDNELDTARLHKKFGRLNHVCQGSLRPQRNHFDATMQKSCNKLCFLREEPRQQLEQYEAELREVIARLGVLKRDISTLEWRRERVDRSMRDGQCSSRVRHVVQKAREWHQKGFKSEKDALPIKIQQEEHSDDEVEPITRIKDYFKSIEQPTVNSVNYCDSQTGSIKKPNGRERKRNFLHRGPLDPVDNLSKTLNDGKFFSGSSNYLLGTE